MTKQRRIGWTALTPTLVLGAVAALALAAPATVPHSFAPNTVADANQVNANFDALKGAIDDNDGRISAIEGGTTTLPLDADLLGGLRANQLVRASHGQNTGVALNLGVGLHTFVTHNVTVPTAGILFIVGNVTAECREPGADTATLEVMIYVDGALVGPVMVHDYHEAHASFDSAAVSVSAAVPVGAGSAAVDLRGNIAGANAPLDVFHRSLTVLFVPFGNAGTQGVLKPLPVGAELGASGK